MTDFIFSNTAKSFRGSRPGEHLVTTVTDTPVVIAPSDINKTLLDVSYVEATTTSLETRFSIASQSAHGSISHTTSTPGICSVNSSTGEVVWVSDGICTINTTDGIDTSQLSRNISKTAGVSNIPYGFVDGSVAKQVSDNITAFVNGLTPNAGNQNVWDGTNRNTGRIASTVDLSASSYTSQYPRHLISPRHIIFAQHINVAVGETVIFVRNDNSTQSVTVLDIISLGNDIAIASLSADVIGVTPYSILPETYDTYIPCLDVRIIGLTSRPALPVLNIEGHTGVAKVRILETAVTDSVRQSTRFATWTSPIAIGDSSGPNILPISIAGTMKSVLLSSMFTPVEANLYHKRLSTIEAAMASLNASYPTLTRVALAGNFVTF
jgi:hypothetical protein